MAIQHSPDPNVYNNITANATEIAIIPDLNNSILTLGPTFSTFKVK